MQRGQASNAPLPKGAPVPYLALRQEAFSPVTLVRSELVAGPGLTQRLLAIPRAGAVSTGATSAAAFARTGSLAWILS